MKKPNNNRMIDWMLSFVAVIVVLSVMGAMDSDDQAISAQVLREAQQQAKSEKEAEKLTFSHRKQITSNMRL